MSGTIDLREPKVSIVTLNWNGLEDTTECLQSLKKITYRNYEVIVVDNRSDGDDVESLKQGFGDYIRIIENDANYGFAEGNNIGIRRALKANAEYVLLLNNDTVVAPDFLTELVKIAESDPRIGLLGPKIYFYNEPNKIWFAGGRISLLSKSSNRSQNVIERGQFDNVDCVDFISGTCILVRRPVLESIGMFDPIYFFSMEDIDLSFRATRAGFRNVFVPTSIIWHKLFRSGSKNPKVPYYTARNAIILARKHFCAYRIAVLRTVFAVIAELLYYAVRNRSLSLGVTLVRGLRDGLTVNLKLWEPSTQSD